MSAPPQAESFVPDPNEDWVRLGGEQLAAADSEEAGLLAATKLDELTGTAAILQNYSVAHDRATRMARNSRELRMRTLLNKTMGDNAFAKHPQPWRGIASQGMVNAQAQTATMQGRWLSGYHQLLDKAEGITKPIADYKIAIPPVAYDWDSLTRMLSYEGDTKFWRDIDRGVHPDLALARAKDRIARIASSVNQVAEQQTLQAILGDKDVVGWQRMCRPNACPWCCLLSSRGGVYRSYETARFGRKGLYHLPRDNCTARPVFRRYEHLPQLTEAAEQRVLYSAALYNDATADSAVGERMDDFLAVAYADPMFRRAPVRTLGRRPTGQVG